MKQNKTKKKQNKKKTKQKKNKTKKKQNKTKQNKHTNEETSNLWIDLRNLKFRNSRELGFLCDCISEYVHLIFLRIFLSYALH